MSYAEFFTEATGCSPYPYQERLSERAPTVLDVPTGLGKTEATVLAWLYRRTNDEAGTPRRLIYCLPMRSLVEQTRDRVESCFSRLTRRGVPIASIEVVMGGDVGEQWFRNPATPCVVIGTQDMLISRALNRGYGMSRFQWPMTFAAANDDVYWVVDEVQLQGIGAITATQLHAFRSRFGTYHGTEITLASATIDDSWFETADFTLAGRPRIGLSDADLRADAVARVALAPKKIERAVAYEPKEVAALARERHRAGTRTLVVVNRVARAQEIYSALARDKADVEIVLLHSRYRRDDREQYANRLLAHVENDGPGRIVVATQVVEAGIDVSAATLITDAAPWSSLVQRFGRCNRRGEDQAAACIWLDAGETTNAAASPYEANDLNEGRRALLELDGASAAPLDLPKRPIPLRSGLVLRKPDFVDLFDTSPDLAGHDVDVSPYIRDAEDVSVSLFWRGEPPDAGDPLAGVELCTAPISKVRELVKSLRASGHGADARISNQFSRQAGAAWTPLHDVELRPGAVVWLRSDVGWYDTQLGFTRLQQRVEPVRHEPIVEFTENCPMTDSDRLSWQGGKPVTLTRHAQDTLHHARVLTSELKLSEQTSAIVLEAALWHDVGKAHPVFQDTMRRANEAVGNGETTWAKGQRRATHTRPGFRHELPGALCYLNAHDGKPAADLIAYLIAAHHGKLRLSAQQLPYEAPEIPLQLLGNRDGDETPAVDLGEGVVAPAGTISLAPFRIGNANGERCWIERTVAIRDDRSLGPFRIAYLELLVRLADWRASAEEAQ